MESVSPEHKGVTKPEATKRWLGAPKGRQASRSAEGQPLRKMRASKGCMNSWSPFRRV